jgi:spermidine synthase
MSLKNYPKLLSPNRFAALVTESFNGNVFLDIESHNRLVVHCVDEVTVSKQSQYQLIEIFKSPHLGSVLSLDGKIQVAETDEYLYHELLVHPACTAVPKVQSALVLGGGDGCAVRELLKYKEIETLLMVDLDQDVIELCRQHYSSVNCRALDDPRVQIQIRECRTYLEETSEQSFDVIIADLTEPYDPLGDTGDLSRHIFSTDFYDFLKSYLTSQGILAVQTGGVTFNEEYDKFHRKLIQDLKKCFRSVAVGYVYVHSFDAIWSITLAADYEIDLTNLNVDSVLKQKEVEPLLSYDSDAHRAAFRPNLRLRNIANNQ